MSEYKFIINFSDFKNDSDVPQNFGNDWGLFIDLDDDNMTSKKETHVYIDIEDNSNIDKNNNSNHTNNNFDYLYGVLNTTMVIIISITFICIVFYI